MKLSYLKLTYAVAFTVNLLMFLTCDTTAASTTPATKRTHPFVGRYGMISEELDSLRLASDVDSGRIRCQIYLLAIEALAPTSRVGNAITFLQLNTGLLDRTEPEALVETIEDLLLVYIDRCADSYAETITQTATSLICRALRIVRLKYRVLAATSFGNPLFAQLNGRVQKFEKNFRNFLGPAQTCVYAEPEPLLANITQRDSASRFTLQSISADQLTALTCKASLLAVEALMPERGNPMDFAMANKDLIQVGRAELLNTVEDVGQGRFYLDVVIGRHPMDESKFLNYLGESSLIENFCLLHTQILTVYTSPACERTRRETTPLASAILCKALVNVSLKHKLIDLAISRSLLDDDEEFRQHRREKLDHYKELEQQMRIRCSPNQTLF